MNEVLENLAFDAGRGEIRYRDVRYLLIRPETLRDWHAAVAAEIGAEKAAACAYAGGRTGGLLSSRRFRDALGLDARGAVLFMCQMGTRIGWGAMRLVELDEAQGRLVVEVDGSPFADAGLCDLVRGVLSGLAEGLLGIRAVAEEAQCRSAGQGGCRFIVRPEVP